MADLFDVAEYAVAHGITLEEAEEITGFACDEPDESDLCAEVL